MDIDLPFKVDYAKPGSKTVCKKCNKDIVPEQLQIAEMVQVRKHCDRTMFRSYKICLLLQSQRHDGKDPVWFHKKCFLKTHSVNSRDEFANFEGITYDDQLEILLKIDNNANLEAIAVKRANKKPIESSNLSNFGVDYSTTSDDSCWSCHEKILRNELRFKKIEYNSEVAAKFGKEILWTHLHCFLEKREIFDFLHGGHRLPGYNKLTPEHRQVVREVFP